VSRDIVADIVRNALAPEPCAQDGRPRETPLEERLRLLHNALGDTKQRVGEQQAKLDTLRAELDEYRALMERVKEKAVALERAAAALPAPPPPAAASTAPAAKDFGYVTEISAQPIPSAAPAPLPSIPLDAAAGSVPLEDFRPMAGIPPRRLDEAITPRLSWRQFVPYAAIAVFGVAMSLAVTRRPPEPAQVTLKTASVPPPSLLDEPPAPAAAAAADTPAPPDEESNAEVLALVSSFVPPGGRRSVAEILGPELDDPSTESPWTIMRVDEHTTLVSLRPYGEILDGAPVYEFTVDPAAKTVTAGPETLANLRGAPAPRRTAAR
jgi:hypothetical protein